MLTLIGDLPSNVVGVEADGKVTAEDASAWMVPGEIRSFELDDLDEARAWISE